MSVEITKEKSLTLFITNDDIDTFRALIEKIAKKKMGFLKGDLTEQEDGLVKALDNYFKEEE